MRPTANANNQKLSSRSPRARQRRRGERAKINLARAPRSHKTGRRRQAANHLAHARSRPAHKNSEFQRASTTIAASRPQPTVVSSDRLSCRDVEQRKRRRFLLHMSMAARTQKHASHVVDDRRFHSTLVFVDSLCLADCDGQKAEQRL